MKLPNGQKAVVDIAKLRDYCPNPSHPEGRHKARVFSSALAITRRETRFLRERLLEAARGDEALSGEADEFGERYVIDFRVEHAQHAALVRSAWIVRRGEDAPQVDELLRATEILG